MLLSALIWLISIPLIFLQCSTAQLMRQASGCLKPSYGATGVPFSAVDVFTEWCFALVPVILLWNVKIPRRIKLSLMVILSMGILASIACIVYTALLIKVIQEQNICTSLPSL